MRIFLIFFFSLLNVPFIIAASTEYHVVTLEKAGVLEGQVKFPGETPHSYMYANKRDAQCPRGIPQDHLKVRQDTLGLENVLVFLDANEGKAPVRKPGLITMDGCRLQPRIQWVVQNSDLVLDNKDPVEHPLRMVRDDVTAFELTVEPKTTRHRPMVNTGLFCIHCDKHGWEKAWVYVSAQPYVAITKEHGLFTMTDIPPGDYTLRAWHEGWSGLGKDKYGSPQFHPRIEELPVTIRSKRTTSITVQDLQATFSGFFW